MIDTIAHPLEKVHVGCTGAGCHQEVPFEGVPRTRNLCVACHQVGGPGGNPHPASWKSRHDAGDIGKNSMCRACHRG